MLISLTITPTRPCQDIKIAVCFDGTLMESFYCESSRRIECIIAESFDTQQHSISIEMSGKTDQHTVIDSNNNILTDHTVRIDSIVFDGIDVTEVFAQGNQCYRHNANGTQTEFIDEFYGIMGCNGTVTFEFYTPIHLWMLEHCQ